MLAPILSTAGAVSAAAGGYAYAAMWPESQIFGKTIVAGRDVNEFALTYDDGPNNPETGLLLELLAKHGVSATFFVIGRFVRQRPEIVRAIAAAGHIVGNHSMTHPKLLYCSQERVRQELAGCNEAIEDALGAPVRLMRCPHGMRRPVVLRIVRELGLLPVQWNITAHDWEPGISSAKIMANVEQGIVRNRRRGSGSNILLHDGGQAGLGQNRRATVEATRLLLEKYAANTRFVTPLEWA
jgi:peptidoglycan/xylan/chitin deacetylase (PgdA/CDA1 family)